LRDHHTSVPFPTECGKNVRFVVNTGLLQLPTRWSQDEIFELFGFIFLVTDLGLKPANFVGQCCAFIRSDKYGEPPMAEVLQVKIRNEAGSNAVKRVRRAGDVPAVLYGHQEANVCLAMPMEQVQAAIRHGAKMVELQGDISETALIREVQWDSLGMKVLHVDLARVSATEKVRVTLPLELRGEAPGSRQGGIIEHLIHEIEIECPAESLPERIEVNINSLQVGHAIKLGEIQLPDKVVLIGDDDEMVVHCVAVSALPEEEEAAVAELGEPEVIGRKAEPGDEEED
jgi:large subunit ribosomal protein L25